MGNFCLFIGVIFVIFLEVLEGRVMILLCEKDQPLMTFLNLEMRG